VTRPKGTGCYLRQTLAGHKTVADTTIWVDPGSYLPVRLVSHGQVQRVGNGAGNGPTPVTLTVDFRWLTPTRVNLAKLTAPIPAGFKEGPLPQAVSVAWAGSAGESGDALHVVGHREGVERPQPVQVPAAGDQQAEVAGEGGGVAGDVGEPLGRAIAGQVVDDLAG
jgi:hypothetical protein